MIVGLVVLVGLLAVARLTLGTATTPTFAYPTPTFTPRTPGDDGAVTPAPARPEPDGCAVDNTDGQIWWSGRWAKLPCRELYAEVEVMARNNGPSIWLCWRASECGQRWAQQCPGYELTSPAIAIQ